MKILVTGGCGFIGTNFIKYILNKYKNYSIINLDALTYAANIFALDEFKNSKNYKFVKGNIVDQSTILPLMKQVDVCINFAAETHVDNSIKNPTPFIETNIFGTFSLLESAKKTNLKRYIQISTDEVYGSLQGTSKFFEHSNLDPSSPYSSSKASADLLVMSYYKTYGLPCLVTRCSNNYGPFQNSEKLIPLFLKNLINDNEVPLYGDGLNVRDWIYIEDHCLGIDLVLHSGKIGEVYNISSNCEKTNIEVAKLLAKKLNKSVNLIKYVKDRLGHDRRYMLDNTKIVNELGYKPKFTFEEGIEITIDWYRNLYCNEQ